MKSNLMSLFVSLESNSRDMYFVSDPVIEAERTDRQEFVFNSLSKSEQIVLILNRMGYDLEEIQVEVNKMLAPLGKSISYKQLEDILLSAKVKANKAYRLYDKA